MQINKWAEKTPSRRLVVSHFNIMLSLLHNIPTLQLNSITLKFNLQQET